MKVYLSWSGEVSKQAAKLLANLIPKVIPGIDFLISETNLRSGQRWNTELSSPALNADISILCVTRANNTSPWFLFEAGYLAKGNNTSIIFPLLIDFTITELTGPLTQFQVFETNTSSIHKLLQIINTLNSSSISSDRLEIVAEELSSTFNPTLGVKEVDNEKNQNKSLLSRIHEAQKSFDKKELHIIRSKIETLSIKDSDILLELFKANFNLKEYLSVVEIYDELPKNIQNETEILLILTLAHIRLNKFNEAIKTLVTLIERGVRNAEVYGALGRAYKGLYAEQLKIGNIDMSYTYLQQALKIYLDGFEFLDQDPYLGINASSLLYIIGGKEFDELLKQIIPITINKFLQKIEKEGDDYWNYSSLLELAVMNNDCNQAIEFFKIISKMSLEFWQINVTLTNLENLYKISLSRGQNQEWIAELLKQLKEVSYG